MRFLPCEFEFLFISLLYIQISISFQTGAGTFVLAQQSHKVNCQIARSYLDNSNWLAPDLTATESKHFNRVSYKPRCRTDLPELFEARQCSQYDCFCVNVTSGVIFLGTRSSPSEVGDCSTALYSVFLAIHNPFYRPTFKNAHVTTDNGNVNPTVSPEQEKQLRARISSGLDNIFRSATGFQRITAVSKLYAVPKAHTTTDTLGSSDLLYYKVYFLSVGHSTVNALKDLLEHRLHEGYLPEVGHVDPAVSYVELIDADVTDSLTSVVPFDMDSPILHDAEYKSALAEPQEQDRTPSEYAISRLPDHSSIEPATSVRAPGEKIERGSRQLPDEPQLAGGFVAPPVPVGSSAIHQPWPAHASRVNILRQPGVIAGIVGSSLVILLLLILLILFCIYRLRKKDEGSYALDESKKIVRVIPYQHAPTREFYA